jgi:predicted HAD superfamily Cof-like phosphohydrolase
LAFPIQQQVIGFHRKFGHPVRDTPQVVDQGEAELAYGFIEEELYELNAALYPPIPCDCGNFECDAERGYNPYNPDVVEVADALGDIVFTAYGMAARFGIDLDRVLAAICESNMSKTANGQNKILKGEDYFPPRIAEALGL